jgi:hypothetical protein
MKNAGKRPPPTTGKDKPNEEEEGKKGNAKNKKGNPETIDRKVEGGIIV